MDIMELGAIGELVGGVAVIASLIFVGFQVRQNTAAIRADSAQGFADSINGAILKVAGGGESARCLRLAFENSETMTDDEKITADHLAVAAFQSYDSGLLQAKLGSLDEATRNMIHRRIQRLLEFEYYRDWWSQNPWEFSEPLTRFVEQECGLRRKSRVGFEMDDVERPGNVCAKFAYDSKTTLWIPIPRRPDYPPLRVLMM